MAAIVNRRPLVEQIALPGLVEHYMSRIWQFNGDINAVVEAFAVVSESQANPRATEGLPFLVKDSLDVEVCGDLEFAGNPPAGKDSKNVTLLRQLGAVPVGKTNVPYLSLDVQTFNDVYWPTCNPYNPELSAGGSSGGSAAAVAAGMTAFAVGTYWNGSLRIPARGGIVLWCKLAASNKRKNGVLRRIWHDISLTKSMVLYYWRCTGHRKRVADVKFVMNAVFLLVPGGNLQDKMLFLFPTNCLTVAVWTSFSGVPLDERIRDSMRSFQDDLNLLKLLMADMAILYKICITMLLLCRIKLHT